MKYKLSYCNYFFNVFLPLVLGCLIYVCFRVESMVMFKWFELLKINNFTSTIRGSTSFIKPFLPNWFLYSLPDGLWIYAFTSALIILWNGEKTFWILLPLSIGFFLEVGQALNIINGTFDILDLIFTIVAFALSILFFKHKFNKNDKTILQNN